MVDIKLFAKNEKELDTLTQAGEDIQWEAENDKLRKV